MRKFLPFLFVLIALCFSCEKDNVDVWSVSGTLTAGNDLSPVDLSQINIYLGKYAESLSLQEITTKTDDIVLLKSTQLDEEGSFEFTDLQEGIYSLVLDPQFIFTHDTIQVFRLDGKEKVVIQKPIERIPQENVVVVIISGDENWKFKIKNDLPSDIRLDSCRTYFGGEIVGSYYLGNSSIMEFNYSFPESAESKEVEFVFYNTETATWFYSPIFEYENTDKQVPTEAGPVKIDYKFKWSWFSKTFFFED